MIKKPVGIPVLFFGLGCPTSARAHEYNMAADNPLTALLSGMSHPVTGLDHFLAMFAVGFVSIFYRPKDIWIIPSIFLVAMLLGFVGGLIAGALPVSELAIALSVILLGLCMAAQGSIPRTVVLLLVAVFALFHGHVHAIELPNAGATWIYAVGFLSGTAGIHIGGILVAEILRKPNGANHSITFVSALVIATGFFFTVKQFIQ